MKEIFFESMMFLAFAAQMFEKIVESSVNDHFEAEKSFPVSGNESSIEKIMYFQKESSFKKKMLCMISSVPLKP